MVTGRSALPADAGCYSPQPNMTVPIALGRFLNSDEAPQILMMATAIIYAWPPIVIYYVFRRHMGSGLTMGGVKG
jgi:multiple sugar transport system permease protein